MLFKFTCLFVQNNLALLAAMENMVLGIM